MTFHETHSTGSMVTSASGCVMVMQRGSCRFVGVGTGCGLRLLVEAVEGGEENSDSPGSQGVPGRSEETITSLDGGVTF